MDEAVHPSETWLPQCVTDDDRSLTKDENLTAVTTFTQLKNACPVPSAVSVNTLKATEADIISLGEPNDTNARSLRPHSTPATLLWLEENYETAEGVCIPRSTLYMHYVDFCERNGMQPVNAASFGKIIRQQFPHLTTRRLGTRGQSRYHYYGIAVKESSSYYDVSYSKRGCGNIHESKKEPVKQASSYTQRTKTGTLLPDFTHFKDLNLPSSIPEEKVSTFLMMYRTHCQRILDTVISASFDEVQSFLLHFWKGMPSHISSILSYNATVNMIGVCDSFVYKAISNVLFPSVHKPLPDSLIQVVRKFSKDLTVWLRMALDDVPENLRSLKCDLAKCFSRTLRRQTSLNHLCQASRMVIHNSDITSQMLQDWRHVDLDGISRQILFTVDGLNHSGASIELITNLYKEFETLLEDQAPIEAFMEWLESLVDRCVIQPSRKCKSSVRRLARQFLLMWSSFGTRVIRDMTLQSAPSFGSFHLLHLTFDDYVLFLVESLHWEERTQELFANIPNDAPPNLSDTMLDETVVDAEVGMSKLKWYNPQTHGSSSGHSVPPSLSMPSPSSHSHASSNEVLTQSSPAPNVLETNTSMSEDAEPPETPEDNTGQIMGDYTNLTPDHYSGAFHYGSHDVRTGYNYNSSGIISSRQDSRNYSNHTSNQYAMNGPAAVDVQQVECVGRNVINSGTRGSTESLANGLEYSNFVQYPSRGRADYSDCHGYVYEQPAAPIIYTTPTNCYYQPYDTSGSPTVYCAPRYSVRTETPANKDRMDSKVPESIPPSMVYGVASPGNVVVVVHVITTRDGSKKGEKRALAPTALAGYVLGGVETSCLNVYNALKGVTITSSLV